MGIIQKILAKAFNENPAPVAEPASTNDDISILGASMTIGDNKIQGFKFAVGCDIAMLMKQDFDNGPLAFLKHGKYVAIHLTFAPVVFGSSELKLKHFLGEWEQGNLVCDKFRGEFNGGTLDGKFETLESEFNTHPGASISGDFKTPTPHIMNTLTGAGHKKKVKWIQLTNKNISSYIRSESFKGSEFIDSRNEVRLNQYLNTPVFGVSPIGIQKIDSTSKNLSVSLLSLNSGQYVSFKDARGRVFSFEVIESYKFSGNQITLRELTHNKNEVVLTWNHFRVSTTPGFNKLDFDAHSSLQIGLGLRIPKLFEKNIVDDVVEIIVTNDAPELPTVTVVDKESTFVPTKIKF
ncbi:MAG: hypothetical protein P8J32_02355 [bacterium]|nr:hypothetical protein [bacterium]